MTTAILTRDQWCGLLDHLPSDSRDVYFTPGYHDLHSIGTDDLPQCYRLGDDHEALYLPGMLMTIPGDRAGRVFRDFQTCNGYGGPFATGPADAIFLQKAWRQWRHDASDQGIVATFFRLHPLTGNERLLPPSAVIRKDRSTVYVDLTQGVEAAWKRATGRHRNMVNKGRRCGFEVHWNNPRSWEEFQTLYSNAMERLEAPASLRFSLGYFAALRDLPEAQLATIHAGGRLMSAAIFLFSTTWAHYHLSARDSDAENCMMNHLLQAAFERASERGLRGVHLGGGKTTAPDDPLLKFKQSTGGALVDFNVAIVVSDDQKYQKLCEGWIAENSTNPSWLLAYRQPNPKSEK